MNSFLRKLRWLTQRSDREAELREELQFHLDEEAEQRLGDQEAARRELGNLALVEENTRAAWGWTRLEQLARDAGYGLRQIRRNPAFSAIAIATLALGIGGITAMFSAVDAVLIRPLPYADADRLVMIWDDLNTRAHRRSTFPRPPNGWSGGATTRFSRTSRPPNRADATLSGDREPEQVPARKATANLWSVLGVKPLIGRVFTEEEDAKGVRVARHQPRTVAAALRRLARRVGPQDHRERQSVRSDRRDAARVLLHARARYRHLDAGFLSRLDATRTSRGTTRRWWRG